MYIGSFKGTVQADYKLYRHSMRITDCIVSVLGEGQVHTPTFAVEYKYINPALSAPQPLHKILLSMTGSLTSARVELPYLKSSGIHQKWAFVWTPYMATN